MRIMCLMCHDERYVPKKVHKLCVNMCILNVNLLRTVTHTYIQHNLRLRPH